MTEYMGEWVFTCRNVLRSLYGRRGVATVRAESLERASEEVRKAGARELFKGAGMWPNFEVENLALGVRYVGTWVCLCHNAELHGQSEEVVVIARSETEARLLVCEEGAIELFDGNREMREHFVARQVRALSPEVTQAQAAL